MKFLDNHGEKILYTTWGILFLIILIAGCDVKAHAATNNSSLPYLTESFDNWTNYDGYSLSDLEDYYNGRWGQFYPLNWSGPIFGYETTEVIGAWGEQHFTILFVPSESNANYYFENSSNIYSQFDVNNDYITFKGVNYGIISYSTYRNHYNDPEFSGIGTQSIRLFYGGKYPDVSNGNFYFNKNENGLITPSDEIIFGPSQPAIIIEGHAVQPNIDGDNVDPNELPDISSHQPSIPSPPTVDTSSPSTLLNSIFELLKWGFNALISSINGFMSYIGDLFSYLFQLLINNIKNAIDNIYQNFANLFEPILNGLASLAQNISDKVDYITAPLDPSTIATGIQSTDLVSDVTGYKTALNTFIGSFNNVSEPSTYKIPIHFENISMFSDVGVQYLDLGWLNSVKTIIRGFVACLVTYGVIISIFDSVPNYINGGGGEDD